MFLNLLLFLTFAIPAQSGVTTAVVPASDGVPIHYAVQGKGEPALVFIHCWTCAHLAQTFNGMIIYSLHGFPSSNRVEI